MTVSRWQDATITAPNVIGFDRYPDRPLIMSVRRIATMKTTRLEIELGPYWAEFLAKQLDANYYLSSGEVIRAGLRLLLDQQFSRGHIAQSPQVELGAFVDEPGTYLCMLAQNESLIVYSKLLKNSFRVTWINDDPLHYELVTSMLER